MSNMPATNNKDKNFLANITAALPLAATAAVALREYFTNPKGNQPQNGGKTVSKTKAAPAPKINHYDDAVSASSAKLAEIEAQKPAAYQSSYQGQIDALLNDILQGEKFNYDVEADPLYKQYKDQYITLGNQAMRDTTGNAAALTGGYGNSYAATAGNQAYQSYLGQLNNVVPSLYNSAMAVHQNKQAEKQNQLAALNSQESMDYQKYANDVGAYQNQLNYWYQKYRDDQMLQANWKK